MDEQQGNFKVTDRRLFNTDGSPRDIPEEEKREPEVTVKTSAEQPAPNATATAEEPRADAALAPDAAEEDFDEAEMAEAQDPASFVNFAMSIASNAASALGMMEHPVTHKREVDLELGKHWIDVLGMFEKKTKGNLTVAEAKILESWLADLRMQYVSLTGPSAPKASGAYTVPEIIGGKS